MHKLADYLTEKFGRVFSLATLKNARHFYQTCMSIIQQVSPLVNLEKEKSQTVSSLLKKMVFLGKAKHC
jgi:hypothetical protein